MNRSKIILERANKIRQWLLQDKIFNPNDTRFVNYEQLLREFTDVINKVIEDNTKVIDLMEWVVNTGLPLEINEKLNEWLKDGTLETIINETIFTELNNKIKDLENGYYILKQTDNIQTILNTKKMIFIPNDISIVTDVTLKTGMDGQCIKGCGSVIRNISNPSENVRLKVSTLHVNHRDVEIDGIVLIGKQKLGDTGIETISTGHNFYISNLPNANITIKNCTAINGYNGFTAENGTSHVNFENCVSINNEHGIQLFACTDINIINHIHKVKPFEDSKGYSQRSVKLQSGVKRVNMSGLDLQAGRITALYFRNEAGDTNHVENVNISNLKCSIGDSLLDNYKTFSGVYFEHEGDTLIKNINISNINIGSFSNGIYFSSKKYDVFENISLTSVIGDMNIEGRTLGYRTGSGNNCRIKNLNVNNLTGTKISINGSGAISNLVTDVYPYITGDIVCSSISIGNSVGNGIECYLSGDITESRIPFPYSKTKDDIIILGCMRNNSQGVWSPLTYSLTNTGIDLDPSGIGYKFKILLKVF